MVSYVYRLVVVDVYNGVGDVIREERFVYILDGESNDLLGIVEGDMITDDLLMRCGGVDSKDVIHMIRLDDSRSGLRINYYRDMDGNLIWCGNDLVDHSLIIDFVLKIDEFNL